MTRRPLQSLPKDERGIAAVEFALMAPMMFLVLFGSIDVTDARSAQSRIESVAGSVADVVSRDNAITNAEMADIFRAADLLMFPQDPATTSVVVSRVDVTGPGSGTVRWSDSLRGNARAANSTISDLPANVEDLCPGATVVLTEVETEIQSLTGLVFGPIISLDARQITCPRRDDNILRVA